MCQIICAAGYEWEKSIQQDIPADVQKLYNDTFGESIKGNGEPNEGKVGACCWGARRPFDNHQRYCQNITKEKCDGILGHFCDEGTECITYPDDTGIYPSCPCKKPMGQSVRPINSNKERQNFWEDYINKN